MELIYKDIVFSWLNDIVEKIKKNKSWEMREYHIADIGSYDVGGRNGGSVRNFIESMETCICTDCHSNLIKKGGKWNLSDRLSVTGFDVKINHKDDIEIKSGLIPKEHHTKYDYVTCLGTFNYGDNNQIMEEIISVSKYDTKILINLDEKYNKPTSGSPGIHYKKNIKVFGIEGFKEFIKKYPDFEIYEKPFIRQSYAYFKLIYKGKYDE